MKVTKAMQKNDPMLSRLPDVRPLLERIKGKRTKPGQTPDAQKQLIFPTNGKSNN